LATDSLKQFSRIVIKVGSSLLVDPATGLRQQWLKSFLSDVAEISRRGSEVLIVSSGAIALGRQSLKSQIDSNAALKLEESQAAAAIGQIALSQVYAELLKSNGFVAAQILLTIDDTEQRHRYLNARNTIETALKWKAIPIINENDSVATSEIRYGDNDRLAARVASMIGADLLILFSDIDGLFDLPPQDNPGAKLIEHVPTITDEIEAMAGEAASVLSRGGMKTKIDAAKISTAAGARMVIASGVDNHPLKRLEETQRGTWFDPAPGTINQRKKWIAGGLDVSGKITIDAGALIALERGKSLLPAGVIKVEGSFERGDLVDVLGPNGHAIARGLIEYDSQNANSIIGLKSDQVVDLLGTVTRSALIHRNNLAMD
jgi:glutamate 5-kinase